METLNTISKTSEILGAIFKMYVIILGPFSEAVEQ